MLPFYHSRSTTYAFLLGLLLQQQLIGGRISKGSSSRILEATAASDEKQQQNEDPFIQVVVGYHKKPDRAQQISQASLDSTAENATVYPGTTVHNVFKRVNAVSMTIPASQVSVLENDPNVAYVRKDAMRYLLTEEIPWGVAAVGAAPPSMPLTNDGNNNGNSYNDDVIPLPNPWGPCFKVCVIDSGLMVDHPDIPYRLGDNNLEGTQIGIPSGQYWYNPRVTAGHGTHVTGTIVAQGGNDIGVAGVIPNNAGICLMQARVFADNAQLGQLSTIIDMGMEWCADNGARVINLSLGGPEDLLSSRELHQRVHDEGVLVISASGNDGSTDYSYPASYDSVMSVAAIDRSKKRANFSQYNDQVDVTAPGTNIRSTSPGIEMVDDRDLRYNGVFMEFAEIPIDDQGIVFEANLVYCGLGTTLCEGAFGNICLIERGNNTFAEKAINCEVAGGVGVLVFNSGPGLFVGTLGASGLVSIPAMSLSREEGLRLLSANSIRLDFMAPVYLSQSGTSMAAPHVAAAAARVWAARPSCSHIQVREALQVTAEDLGPPGKDNEYGHGLINAVRAYEYLLSLKPPCGRLETPPPSGAPTSSAPPTGEPTGPPSVKPSAPQTPSPTLPSMDEVFAPQSGQGDATPFWFPLVVAVSSFLVTLFLSS